MDCPKGGYLAKILKTSALRGQYATAFSRNTLKIFILQKDWILHRYPLGTHGMNYFKNIAWWLIENCLIHTSAKLIAIRKNYLQKINGLDELGSCIECNDTLHGFELGQHWVLEPNYSKNFAQKFLYTGKAPWRYSVGFWRQNSFWG